MFKIIKDFPNYRIYSNGTVKNCKTGNYITKRIIRGYYYVDLRCKLNNKLNRKNCRLGRLVATYFIPNPLNLPQVNHKDGNCLNDNVNNLEWVTVSQNQIHKIKLQKEKGTYKTPKGNRKFSERKIYQVHQLRKQGLLQKDIAKKLKMGVSTVTHILLGTRRKVSLKSLISNNNQNTLPISFIS